MELVELVGDAAAITAAGVAVLFAVRAERRLRRERARTDRLYLKLNKRLAEHIRSRLH